MKIRLATLATCLLVCGPTIGGEISVLSGGAIAVGVRSAVTAFQKETGHQVNVTFAVTPALIKRVTAGETFDVVIAPPSAIDAFAKDAKSGGERANVGRVGLGIVSRPGAAVPEIASVEGLKHAVLEADSLAYNRASTGIYLENLFKKIGVHGQIEAKTTRYEDASAVMEHVIKGKGKDIGFGSTTVIASYKSKGVRFIGPLPAEVQDYTSYTAMPMSSSSNAEIASAFVRFLGSPAGKRLFAAAGIE